jgi:hypothetical protein
MKDKDEMNAAWTAFFKPEDLPARATVAVAQLGPQTLIEVIATATPWHALGRECYMDRGLRRTTRSAHSSRNSALTASRSSAEVSRSSLQRSRSVFSGFEEAQM